MRATPPGRRVASWAKMRASWVPPPRAGRRFGGLAVLLVVVLICVSGWAAYATTRLVQQRTAVQVGTATLKAWPALDAGAKRAIQAAGSQ